MYPHKLLSSYKEKSSEESDNWLMIKINMTEEKMDMCMCASRCDILRKTQYHLYSIPTRNAYFEYNL